MSTIQCGAWSESGNKIGDSLLPSAEWGWGYSSSFQVNLVACTPKAAGTLRHRPFLHVPEWGGGTVVFLGVWVSFHIGSAWGIVTNSS